MKAKSPLKTLSLSQMMNGDAPIGTAEIFGDLEQAVDDITGNGNDREQASFIKIIALIEACPEGDLRDLIISEVLNYAYTRTGHNQQGRKEYIASLFAPAEGGEA